MPNRLTWKHWISIHAPRVGSDSTPVFSSWIPKISIHAPRVGSDPSRASYPGKQKDFNPRSPCGERHLPGKHYLDSDLFQSTLPVWGATISTLLFCLSHWEFQSTLPVWGATGLGAFQQRPVVISIHAPRVGSDIISISASLPLTHFNPRSPCGERRCSTCVSRTALNFNPRSPCGERRNFWRYFVFTKDFNPRSPCGERLCQSWGDAYI